MTAFHWASQVNGSFATASNWNPSVGAPPASLDDALLDAAGATNYTVTSSTSATVKTLQGLATGNLSITGGTFTATNGTGAGAWRGILSVGNNTALSVAGTFKNVGQIKLNSVGNTTDFIIGAGGATLTGAGKVILGDASGANRLYGVTAGTVLTNFDNTISGGGTFGAGQLTLVNQAAGVIKADSASLALVLNTGSVITNTGLITATGAGGLTIANSTVNGSTGGSIFANGGAVRLQSTTVVGGTLKDAAGGVIQTIDGGNVFDGTTSTVNNQAQVSVNNNTLVELRGAINNTGSIKGNSVGNSTDIRIGSAGATLTGGGSLILGDASSANRLYGITGAASLTNVNNTISGGGGLGVGQLTLTNQAAGVINANAASNALVLNTGNTVTNAGLITSTGAAGLTITSTAIDNTSGGSIFANGGNIRLQSATVIGGTLSNAAGGVIQTIDGGNVFDGTTSTVNNQAQVAINNNTLVELRGAINNTGSIKTNSVGNFTDIRIGSAGATLTGGGALILGDASSANRIYGVTAAATLTNTNNTISGGGGLGAAQLTLINQAAGVINADAASNALVVNTTGKVLANQGLMKATGAAGMTIQNTTVNNAGGGLIQANGSVVRLQSANIIDGRLTTTAGGSFQTVDSGNIYDGLDKLNPFFMLGSTVVNNATRLTVQGNINLTEKVGPVVTNGTIALTSVGNFTDLVSGVKNATLKGGFVTMSNSTANRIMGTVSGTVAKPKVSSLNLSKTVVSGAGSISNVKLTNSGTVNATSGAALVIQTGYAGVANSNIVKNSGLLQSTNAAAAASVGGLVISNTNVLNDSKKGIVQADGANTHVDLQSATITGGTLKTTAGGVITTVDSGSVLDGTTLNKDLTVNDVNNTGTINVRNASALTIKGAIDNSGTISLTSVGNFTDLLAGAGGATLTGGGTVTLSDSTANRIYGATGATVLTNTNNTISGAGQIGVSQLTLVNQASGVITAVGGNALVIDPSGVTTNSGLMQGTGAGGLTIRTSTVDGSTGGVIQANTGSRVTLQTATLVGGTLKTGGTGFIQTVDGGTVLDGTTSTVNNQGTLNVNNASALSLKGTINNTGGINVNSVGNFTDLIITNSNATLMGSGTLTLSNSTANRVYGASAAAVLTNKSTIQGAGALGSGTLTLANNGSGVIKSLGSNALTINTGANAIANAGLIEANSTGGVTISSAITNTGTLKATSGVLYATQAVSGAGNGIIAGGTLRFGSTFTGNVTFTSATGRLDLANSQSYTGTVSGLSLAGTNDIDLRDITFNASTTATYTGNASGGTLKVTNGSQTANIALFGNYLSSTFVVANDGSGGTLVHDPAASSSAPLVAAPH